ncbi:MAG: TrmH family RNA methyltransferase [Desulfosarcinaceae bacterium]|nr:TrmH family RNA methyltransferase [Desulfosarcinaceae bacterium]
MSTRGVRLRTRRKRVQAERRFLRHKRLNRMASPGLRDFIIVLDHLKPNFNIGKIFRSADGFGAREIHLVGIDFFDPAPAMGAFKWVPARFHPDFESCYHTLVTAGFSLFTLEPERGSALMETKLPLRSAFIFGHEEYGLSFDPVAYPQLSSLTIPQCGRTQSLNVSVAASVVMYEYIRQHGGCR